MTKAIPAHPFDPGTPAISVDVPMLIGTCRNESVNGADNPERDSPIDAGPLQGCSFFKA
jgi:hypothetical protein